MKFHDAPALGVHRNPIVGFVLAMVCVATLACSGSDGAPGAPGKDAPIQPPPSTLNPQDDLPGLNIEIVELGGASGANGAFQVGDTMSIKFKVKMNDGKDLPLSVVDFVEAMLSGPTNNYNRVIASQRSVKDDAVDNGDGTYTYTFPVAIPATYIAPYNDTPSFGPEDGELTGQPLQSGTYTVGIDAYRYYTIGDSRIRDAGNTVQDILLGNATVIDTRQVVTQANCNACHKELRAHGTIRRDVRLCVLCHTAGAEDGNEPTVEGGTPGITIQFSVMIHKLHAGRGLPSVNGVTTNTDGSRKYDSPKKPYKIMGFGNSIHDFSHVQFPIWPNMSYPLPRDSGYSGLASAYQSAENAIRSGPAECSKCHGDPDGSGPLEPPAQGNLAFETPRKNTCGSCHDDIDWGKPYASNQQVMPAINDNSTCTTCHPASGSTLAVMEGHKHPLHNSTYNPGLVFQLTKLTEVATTTDGTFDPGEKMQIEFTIKDDAGADVDPANINNPSLVINGPTNNPNLLLYTSIPKAALVKGTNTLMVPEKQWLEFTGRTTGNTNETLTTMRKPLWDNLGATTMVWLAHTVASPAPTLSSAAKAYWNYIDLTDVTSFARGDYIVVDENVANKEEYLRIQWVDTAKKRVWFSSSYSPYDSPWLRHDHDVGAVVRHVNLSALVLDTDYTLDTTNGVITAKTSFSAGLALIVTYTSDFVVPSVYPPPFNKSTDLDLSWSDWIGQPLIDGTYTIGLWSDQGLSVSLYGETNSYANTSDAARQDFLVGSATTLKPREVISSFSNCYSCHNDVQFHGGHRRGTGACLMCHSTAGAEDRPQYVAPGADPTKVSIDFRYMLHKIHKGEELAYASTWVVNGYGSASNYPNNFTPHTYEEVGFPPLNGGTKNCRACHGSSDAWMQPDPRKYPTPGADVTPSKAWYAVCGSCHDSDAAQAHIEVQTTLSGVESCQTCHGTGKEWNVELMHKLR